MVGVEGTTEHSTQGKEVGRGRINSVHKARRLVGAEGTTEHSTHGKEVGRGRGTTEHSTQGKEVGRGRGNYRTQHTGQGGW